MLFVCPVLTYPSHPEEDGVNNEDVDNNSLYTQPEDIYAIYKELSSVSDMFSIAAGAYSLYERHVNTN
jgi:hypothetical protein